MRSRNLSNAALIFLFHFVFFSNANAQWQIYRDRLDDPDLPEFVKLICQPKCDPKVVRAAYEKYYEETIEPLKQAEKPEIGKDAEESVNEYEHLYKVWRTATANYITPEGFVDFTREGVAAREAMIQEIHPKISAGAESNNWEPIGPMNVISGGGSNPISWQANIYSICHSFYLTNDLVVGTESGGAFKSADKGQNWYQIGKDQDFRSVYAVGFWPWNSGYIRVAVPGKIMASDDNGQTWFQTPISGSMSPDFQTYQILFSSNSLSSRVLAATSDGMLRSNDYGKSWEKVGLDGTRVTSLVEHPTNPNTVYGLLYQPNTKMTELIRSDNVGDTWYFNNNGGWFDIPPADQGKIDVWGGRLAVTPAAPNRIYVLLNGFSQPGANLQLDGFIGVYQSDDGGFHWTRKTTGAIGRPYSNVKPNLCSFPWAPWEYNQVTYGNNAIAASTINADHLFLGSLTMYESYDAGVSWTPVGGYAGNIPNIHPDIRHFIVRNTGSNSEEMFWASDGGVNYSYTGTLSTHEARNYGIYAHELWGFDSDSRLNLMGGGSYHNGNSFFSGPAFPNGDWKHTGGAEDFTGYVQYGSQPRMWFVEFAPYAKIAPPSISSNMANYSYPSILDDPAWQPNRQKDYDFTRASRVMVDRNNPKIIYWGKDGKFCRSTNDGKTAEVLHDFGDGKRVEWMEQSQDNNGQVIYAKVETEQGPKYSLYRTDDGGRNWTLKLPEQADNFVFAPLGDNHIYRANIVGGNGAKVWFSVNGGSDWTNITTSVLNGKTIRCILSLDGVENDFYAATDGGGVYNYNYFTNQWDNVSQGLNPGIRPLYMTANYARRKIQLGTFGLGVWELDFNNPIVGQTLYLASDFDKNVCEGDPVHFFNRGCSSAGSTLNWSFPGGSPVISTDENPVVTYSTPGTYAIIMSVTDTQNGVSGTITKTDYVHILGTSAIPVAESFEFGTINPNWLVIDGGGDGQKWSVSSEAGGFGNSGNSVFFPNYFTETNGTIDEIRTVKVNLSNATSASLKFDLAYAYYPTPYYDSLSVWASTDCGKTYTQIYKNGGAAMATGGSSSNFFVPTSSQWTSVNINLNDFLGNPHVLLAFRNHGYYGNNLFLDNINISGTTVDTQESVVQEMMLAPNPSSGQIKVRFEFPGKFEGTLVANSIKGQEVLRRPVQSDSGSYEIELDLGAEPAGIYFLRLIDKDVVWKGKVIVQH